jgi:hypothetical protein
VGVGGLGVALPMPAIGALLAMPFSGGLAYRHPLRSFVAVSIAAWCGALVLPTLPASFCLVAGLVAIMGPAAGVLRSGSARAE